MPQFNWSDATRPRPKKGNGRDPGAVVELTTDVLQLMCDLCYEYLEQTGRKMTGPELGEKLEHPGS